MHEYRISELEEDELTMKQKKIQTQTVQRWAKENLFF